MPLITGIRSTSRSFTSRPPSVLKSQYITPMKPQNTLKGMYHSVLNSVATNSRLRVVSGRSALSSAKSGLNCGST